MAMTVTSDLAKVAVNEENNPISSIKCENKPELIWESMRIIAFNNKAFLNLK
ncbi:hypothetical protein KBA27_05710 [bacterium]|nr:hypothetical protein [bacterium]